MSRASLYKSDNNALDTKYIDYLFNSYNGIITLREMGIISKNIFNMKSSKQLDKNTIVSNNKFDEIFGKSKVCLFYFNASKTKIGVCVWKVRNGVVRYGATMWDRPDGYISRYPSRNYKYGLINTAYGRYIKCPNYIEIVNYKRGMSDKVRSYIICDMHRNGVRGERKKYIESNKYSLSQNDTSTDVVFMKSLVIIFLISVYFPYITNFFQKFFSY